MLFSLTHSSETTAAVLKDKVRVMWFDRCIGVHEPADVVRTLMNNRLQCRLHKYWPH